MDDRYQYLLLMAGCLLITLPLEFLLRARVYRRPRRLLLALLPMLVVFLGVGHPRHRARALVVQRGRTRPASCCRRGCRSRSYVFFLVIPICGLLTYEAVGTVLGWLRQWRGRDA